MSSPNRIRVMVVDDHPIMRNGLRDTLEASGRFEVVGQAEDGEEAVRTVEEIDPQVIVMDVIMPNKDGIDACRDIMELLPETRVLMLTASTEEDAVIEAIAAGATGYLQKYSRPEELVEAVLDVARGRLRIPGKVVREVFALVRGDRELAARQATAKLTARERETLTLFAGGRSYTEIAEARGNSAVTVRNTLYRIQDKLGIGRKQELVIWAVRNGLVDDIVVGNGPAGTGGVVIRDRADSRGLGMKGVGRPADAPHVPEAAPPQARRRRRRTHLHLQQAALRLPDGEGRGVGKRGTLDRVTPRTLAFLCPSAPK